MAGQGSIGRLARVGHVNCSAPAMSRGHAEATRGAAKLSGLSALAARGHRPRQSVRAPETAQTVTLSYVHA
jgi:hypothetical protein